MHNVTYSRRNTPIMNKCCSSLIKNELGKWSQFMWWTLEMCFLTFGRGLLNEGSCSMQNHWCLSGFVIGLDGYVKISLLAITLISNCTIIMLTISNGRPEICGIATSSKPSTAKLPIDTKSHCFWGIREISSKSTESVAQNATISWLLSILISVYMLFTNVINRKECSCK